MTISDNDRCGDSVWQPNCAASVPLPSNTAFDADLLDPYEYCTAKSNKK